MVALLSFTRMMEKNSSTRLQQNSTKNLTSRLHTLPQHIPNATVKQKCLNKSLAKFLKNLVDESTLNWEWYLAPLMFCYNTTYHSTTTSTPFDYNPPTPLRRIITTSDYS
jgi:hypothetical protein